MVGWEPELGCYWLRTGQVTPWWLPLSKYSRREVNTVHQLPPAEEEAQLTEDRTDLENVSGRQTPALSLSSWRGELSHFLTVSVTTRQEAGVEHRLKFCQEK